MRAARNAPCPCGSGKKYKQCHLDADREAERHGVDVAKEAAAAAGPPDKAPLIAGVVGAVVVVATVLWRDWGTALVVAAAWALGQMAWMSFRDPPPVNEDAGDPAALNFGRSEEQKKK